ncbi:MAG: pectate lyase [Prevotella sp.]|nr:pectate lyase [Prevotella sp.]
MIIRRILSIWVAMTMTMAMFAQAPAFPGAEGHGRYVTGGRGGRIVHVTNLNDSGTGSFRQAVSGSDKKIVVFDVGGVIALRSNVNIGANTTIEGQTAPSPGITLRYYTVNPNGNNIIMRFIRIRRGQEKDVNDGADASTARHLTNLMLDHCSLSWSIDEVASFYDNNNFTMQWCTIGESLNNAGHGKGAHGYGGIWGGKLASFHHNLILHVNNRSPRFNGARYNWEGFTSNTKYSEYQWQNAVQAENVDFRNCVVYNCGNGCYGGPGGGYINMVNNYFKSGPAATTNRLTTVTVGASGNAEGYPIYWTMTSRYFLSGNQIDDVADAGWSYMSYDSGTYSINGQRCSSDPNHYYGDTATYYTNSAGRDCVPIKLTQPAPTGDVTTHSALVAYEKVLGYAGASLIPDDVDSRYVYETENATALYTGSVTGKPGRIDKVSDVNGYTESNFGTGQRASTFDMDKDGIADAWELENDLDPTNPSDALLYTIDPAGYYTNIEVYCNSLVQDIMLKGNGDADEAVRDYYPAYTTTNGLPVAAVNPDVAIIDKPNEQDIEATGNITWELSSDISSASSVAGVPDGSIAKYIKAANMTLGSNLVSGAPRAINGKTMTPFKSTEKQNVAASNAVTFTIDTGDEYKFMPTNVAFLISRIGTDSGVADVNWVNSNGTATIESGLEPNRNKEDKGWYTDYSKELDNVAATTGASQLLIYIYNMNAGKEMALGNVVVSGLITSTTSGVREIESGKVISTEYYNLQGMRINQPSQGMFIKVVKTSDNKKKVTKELFR